MASRGLAMSIHRSDEEFRFTFAYLHVPGIEYQAVAFDRNQRRYKLSELPGGSSGSVGLKNFTLHHKTLPHDQITFVGIEKQRQNKSKTPLSLVDKPLPRFSDVLFNIVPEPTDENALLVCFFDMNQRPSRRYILQLVTQVESLKQKGVNIAAVQAVKMDEKALRQWVKENDISFPVGMIQDHEECVRFDWAVCSLPWLILTDKEHIVQAEGFGLNELEDKIREAESAQ